MDNRIFTQPMVPRHDIASTNFYSSVISDSFVTLESPRSSPAVEGIEESSTIGLALTVRSIFALAT